MSRLMQPGQALTGDNDGGLATTQQDAKKSPATSGNEALPTAVDRVRRSGRVCSSNQSLYGSYVHFDDTLPMDQGLLLQPGSDSDDEQQQWAVSPECQASIPAWRCRPARPTASEAKFLQAAQVYPPSSSVSSTPADDADTAAAAARTAAAAATAVAGGILDLSAGEFQALYRATVPKDRAALLASTVAAMDQQLGPHLVKVLQLDTLGSKLRASWQPHEELLFCLGMCDKYGMFKSMRRLFLRSRSANDLNGYYHNVWKTRSTPEADEFLSLREASAGEREVWVFEQGIRDRLKAMWQPAFGDMPVSAAGPAPLRQRPVRMTYVKVTPAAALSAPAAPPAAAPVHKPSRTASTGVGASPLVSPAGAGPRAAAGRSSPGGTLRPPAAVDMYDPAAMAALPAQLPAAAIAPRPGAFVLSSTAGARGRMRLEPGVTHVGAAGQQQQRQPALANVPQPPRPTHASIHAQQQKQQQQQRRPQAPCTLLLVPLPQQQQQQQQHTRQQLVRLMPTQPKPAIAPPTPAGAASLRPQPAADVAGARSHTPAAGTVQAPQQQHNHQQQQLPPVDDGLCGLFPEMPRMPPDLPLPDAADPAALAAWLQALRGCRAAMARFKQHVDATAEAALLDVQHRISQAQQAQAQALGQAEQYLQELSSTEACVVSCLQLQAPAAHKGDYGTQQAQQQGEVAGRQQGHTPHGDVLLSTEAPLSPRVAAKQPLGDLELAVLKLLQGSCSDKKRRRQQQQQQHPDADALASQLAKKQQLAAAGPCGQAAATATAASAVIVID